MIRHTPIKSTLITLSDMYERIEDALAAEDTVHMMENELMQMLGESVDIYTVQRSKNGEISSTLYYYETENARSARNYDSKAELYRAMSRDEHIIWMRSR